MYAGFKFVRIFGSDLVAFNGVELCDDLEPLVITGELSENFFTRAIRSGGVEHSDTVLGRETQDAPNFFAGRASLSVQDSVVESELSSPNS